MAKPIDTQLTTDDSYVGRDATLNDKEAQGFWDSVIGITLSSHREMWTVLIISISTFVAFRDHVSRKIIQVVSDNISTVAYLNHMSRTSHELNQIGTAIWTEAIHHHVSITCCHIAEKQHQTTSA